MLGVTLGSVRGRRVRSPLPPPVHHVAVHTGIKALKRQQLSGKQWGMLFCLLSHEYHWNKCVCGITMACLGKWHSIWSHFAWDCPATYPFRVQYGFDDMFLLTTLQYKHHPVLSTGVFAAPVVPELGTADLTPRWAIIQRDDEPLFFGPCFGANFVK